MRSWRPVAGHPNDWFDDFSRKNIESSHTRKQTRGAANVSVNHTTSSKKHRHATDRDFSMNLHSQRPQHSNITKPMILKEREYSTHNGTTTNLQSLQAFLSQHEQKKLFNYTRFEASKELWFFLSFPVWISSLQNADDAGEPTATKKTTFACLLRRCSQYPRGKKPSLQSAPEAGSLANAQYWCDFKHKTCYRKD